MYTFSYNRLRDVVCTVEISDKEEAQAYFDSSLAALEALYGEFDNLSVETAFEGLEPLGDSELGAFVKHTNVEATDGYVLPGEYISYYAAVSLKEADDGGYVIRFSLGGGYNKNTAAGKEFKYDGPWVN